VEEKDKMRTTPVAEENEIFDIMVEAELYVKYQSYSKAIELLEGVIERFPRYLPAKKTLEDIYRRTGKFEKANEINREVALISSQLATERTSSQAKSAESDPVLKRRLVEKIDSIIKAIYESTEYADILKISAQQLVDCLPADRCIIITLGKDSPAAKYFESCKQGVSSSPANKTAKLNFVLLKKVSGGLEAIAIDETIKDPSLVDYRLTLEELKINAIMAYPLFYKAELIGLIVVHRCAKGVTWSEQEKTLFSTVAGHVAVAISNARQFSAMQTLAIMDKLTNLYNRRFFEERMLVELTNARQQNYPLCLALLDIDHFKKINDTFGHAAGDKVLCKLGFVLSTNLRKGTVVARFGGEEFVVILPNTHLDVAHRIMDGLGKLVSETFATEDGQPITISIGVEEASPESQTDLALLQKEIIEKADASLYQAKRNGRNRVCSAANPEQEATPSC
jgi:diguanylate cyclase (GGDEF)-like protein